MGKLKTSVDRRLKPELRYNTRTAFRSVTSAEPPPLKCRLTMRTICRLCRDLSKCRDDLAPRPDNLGARSGLCPTTGDKGCRLTLCKVFIGAAEAESPPTAGRRRWRASREGGGGPPAIRCRVLLATRHWRDEAGGSAAGGRAGFAPEFRTAEFRTAGGGVTGAAPPRGGSPRLRTFHQDRSRPAA